MKAHHIFIIIMLSIILGIFVLIYIKKAKYEYNAHILDTKAAEITADIFAKQKVLELIPKLKGDVTLKFKDKPDSLKEILNRIKRQEDSVLMILNDLKKSQDSLTSIMETLKK